MGNISLEKVTEQYYDVLKEIGNIGAGNAMTALSQMLQTKSFRKLKTGRTVRWMKSIL